SQICFRRSLATLHLRVLYGTGGRKAAGGIADDPMGRRTGRAQQFKEVPDIRAVRLRLPCALRIVRFRRTGPGSLTAFRQHLAARAGGVCDGYRLLAESGLRVAMDAFL